MNSVLKMINIEKSFPGVKALNKANLNLKKGEVHILLGENGAGKSTLMKILTGIYEKDKGTIIYKDEEVEFRTPKEAQLSGVSIIYQEFNLIPHLSIMENVFLGREPVKGGIVQWKKMKNDTKKILEGLRVNLDPKMNVKDLGVAQQQMVEIAKALSVDADIIVMDEPTAALTSREIDELFKTIENLKRQGVSIVYISHRLEEIKRIGDRVTIMRDGEYIGTVNVKDTTVDEMIEMMVGRTLNDKFPKKYVKKGETILEVKNLKAGKMVKGVDFHVKKGEIVGFAGLMGAGRSETMKAVFGADPIEDGEIYIENELVQINKTGEAINLGIGFLTEDRKNQGLVLELSVRDNISLTNLDKVLNKFKLINLNDEKNICHKYVEDLKVKTPTISQKVKFLSGGNQQKVVLAKWLNRNCKILIFDEPTRGIDVGAKVEIYKLMNELVSQGVAIIMISSELPEILGMSDRIYVMHEGHITGELDRGEATQDKILKYATGTLNEVNSLA
ncbi:sugar ABC transporter ATP-binding protein [Anaeromicrobium sediminis]|uniref:D-xylose ABC transporter ATP-binding protein n=1 Tax=Anaeromicrobium sediminis TaxID=1478221 RepID=A0A267MJC4_9FIRM|nr:sugar ABC transporter ATP-binding protein [Anaeromicrobium sediminis]PAB58965.1 D-xylose ABC transporter ATP-binding protein [Anaeromicrobium sediminis]